MKTPVLLRLILYNSLLQTIVFNYKKNSKHNSEYYISGLSILKYKNHSHIRLHSIINEKSICLLKKKIVVLKGEVFLILNLTIIIMKKFILISVIIFLIINISIAQYTNVLITNSGSPNEPSICINPKTNTNIVVAGSNLKFYFIRQTADRAGQSRHLLRLTASGRSFHNRRHGGKFLLRTSYKSFGGYFIDRIVVQKSTNSGANWNNGSFAGYIPLNSRIRNGCALIRRVITFTWHGRSSTVTAAEIQTTVQ